MPSMRRLAALLLAAALPTGVALVVPVGGAEAQPRPVAPGVRSSHLHAPGSGEEAGRMSSADASAATARSAPGPRANGSRAKVLAVSDQASLPSALAVVGVTWGTGSGVGASVQYRTRTDGRWTAWTFLDDSADEGPDGREAAAARTRAGSQPLVVTGATAVQMRMVGLPSAASADPQLVVVDPGTSPADDSVGTAQPGAAHGVASRPVIYTRAQWGADESLRDPSALTYGAVKAAVVHHTVDANGYSSSQVPALIRGIYAFHVKGRGWSDIGYNFLVDRFGRTWEGRYGGTTKPVVGAQTLNHNSWTTGISVIGNFDTSTVPTAVTAALRTLIAWKAQLHEFNPAGIANIGENLTTYSVLGHRDAYQTACPGRYLYAQIPGLRTGAAASTRGLPSLTLDRDLDNRGDADVLATNARGDLLLYPTTNQRSVLPARSLSSGQWVGMDLVTVPGDFSGDGAVDLVARQVSTGKLVLYRGSGSLGLRAGTVIGTGWGAIDRIIGVGDWTGDGHPDLLARMKADSTLRLYPGNGRGGFLASRIVGTGWSGMSLLTGVGDWTGDGYPDLLAVSTSGTARIYLGNGRGGFAGSRVLSGSWGQYRAVVGVGDASWDTRTDILVVDASGAAKLGLGSAAGGDPTWVPVSQSFGGVDVYTG